MTGFGSKPRRILHKLLDFTRICGTALTFATRAPILPRQDPARPYLITIVPWYAPYVAKAWGWLSDAASLPTWHRAQPSTWRSPGRLRRNTCSSPAYPQPVDAVHNPNRMPLLGVGAESRLGDAAGAGGREPPAALPLPGEHRGDGGGRAGLAGRHRRPARDRHRGAVPAGAAPASSQRDQRQPGEHHDPDRRLSRRAAARPAAARTILRGMVALDPAALPARVRAEAVSE